LKLIAISDIHGYVDRLREVLARENDVEVIVFSGDIAPYRNHLETLNSLKRLLSIAKNFNIGYVVAVPGNVDYINHYKQLEDPTFIYIHEECERIKDALFIGFGGSTITPFNTILEYSEEDIYRALQSVYTKCKGKTTLDNEFYILVTHAPPYNTACDRIFSGNHIGSKAIRSFIEYTKPTLALCGHVHESRCIDRIDRTIIINPGPLAKGFYSTIDIDGRGNINVNLNTL